MFDAYAERVKAAGGRVHRAPVDIPGVGRFAVAADPHGAVFILFKGSSDQEPVPAAPGTPGHVGWHELHAGDGESAFTFYSGLFGWTKQTPWIWARWGFIRSSRWAMRRPVA